MEGNIILAHVKAEVKFALMSNDKEIDTEIADHAIGLIDALIESGASLSLVKEYISRLASSFDMKNISELTFKDSEFIEKDGVLVNMRNTNCIKFKKSGHIIDHTGIEFFRKEAFKDGVIDRTQESCPIKFATNPKIFVINEHLEFTGKVIVYFRVSEDALHANDVFMRPNYSLPVVTLTYGNDIVFVGVFENDVELENTDKIKYVPVAIELDAIKGISISDERLKSQDFFKSIIEKSIEGIKENI